MSAQTASHGRAAPTIHERQLPYCTRLENRPVEHIDLLVVHCTELPDLAAARSLGERIIHASGTGNCGHLYIDRDGRIERWIDDDRIAHHVRGYNARSLGIELVHAGRWPDWYDSRRQVIVEPYPAAQIDALVALLLDLRRRLPGVAAVAGHEDLDRDQVAASDAADRLVRRKVDPGPTFPWPQVLADSGLPRWMPPTDHRLERQ